MERAWKLLIPTLRAVRHYHRQSVTVPLLNRAHRVQWNVSAITNSSSSAQDHVKSGSSLSADVVEALKSAHKSDDILAIVQANELNGNQASLALSALKNSMFLSDQDRNLQSDTRFVTLIDTIGSDVTRLSTESLVNSLINLLKLDDGDPPVMHVLETECSQRLRAMTIRHIGFLVCNSPLLSKKLSSEALRVLQLRWKELNNPYLLKRLLKTSLQLSAVFAERLEDKTLEMVDHYSFQDLVDIAGYFTSARRISTLVMRAISYQVVAQRNQWEMSHLLRLIGHMGYSRYYNSLFLKEAVAFCKDGFTDCSTQQISEIVRSFGMLRMPETELFSAVITYLERHLADFSPSELQTIVSGLSMVNFKPPTEVVVRLVSEFESLTFTEQIEFCLALAVFDGSSHDQLRRVFESADDIKEIMDSDKAWHIPTQLKLLQLNTYAKAECPGYDGPYLPAEVTRYPKVRGLSQSNLQKDVVAKLEALLGDKKFLNTLVGIDSGYVIDAEMAVSQDGTPYSGIDYNISSNSADHSPLRKDLTHGITRVAVIVNGPACYLYNSSELTGRRLLMLRQLQALNYHLIPVPFKEWSAMTSDSKKMEYLQQKLEGIVKLS